MATSVTLYHPVFENVTRRVDPARVDAWVASGWLLEEADPDYVDHADVFAVQTENGVVLRAILDNGTEITVPPVADDDGFAAFIQDEGTATGAALATTFALKGEAGGISRFASRFPVSQPADTPATTVLARADSTLVPTGTLVRETRYTAADGFESMAKNDPSFRFDGSPELRRLFADPTQYVAPAMLPGGDAQYAYHNYAVETVTSAPEMELRLRSGTPTMVFRVFVDGRPTTVNALHFQGLTAGQPYNLRLVFPTTKPRTVKVMFGDNTGFGGVYVPTGATLTRPVGGFRLRAAIIGDSYEGGAGFPGDGGTRLDTGGLMASIMLGADSIWNYGIGGTGHVATANTFQTRADEVAAITPDIVIISGSINDGTEDTPAIRAAVAAELALLANVPEVYVTGPSRSLAYAGNNTAVREATLAAGRVFLDPLTPDPWLTPDMIGTDGAHPTWTGHQRRATRIFDGIAARREFLTPLARQSITGGAAPVTPPPAEPSPVGVSVADTFDRADSTTLGSTPAGDKAWVTTGTGWSITGNQLAYSSTTEAGSALVAGGGSGTKHVVRSTFAAPAGVAQAMFAHVNAAKTAGYVLNRSSANQYKLRRYLGGTSFSDLSTVPTVVGAAGDVCEIEFRADNTIVARVNGVEAPAVTDTSSRAGEHGFYAYANHAAKFDNFQVEILP